MMELPYGRGKISFNLPTGWAAEVLRPREIPPAPDPAAEIARSLKDPLGGKRLEDFRDIRSVAIALSDETRPVPNTLLLPLILRKLPEMGIPPSAVTLLVASGLHTPMPPSRFANIFSAQIIRDYPIWAHDAKAPHLTFLGKTSRGTPVYVNPLFQKADLRIVLGLIDPHQFVGYTGGVKAAAVGLAGAQTIEANHSLLFQPQAVVGEIQGNPVRQDIEEVGKLMRVDFVVNVVLDEGNRVLKAFSGDPLSVEAAGSAFCREVYEVPVTQDYDIVIASPGGYPKDINLYQAQKGLAHATPLVRRGGDILLLAECPDGHGEEVFYQTMREYGSPEEIVEEFPKKEFKMGAHKAFLWARSLTKARVHLYSTLEEKMGRELMVHQMASVEETLKSLQAKYKAPPRIAAMAKANSVYARVQHLGSAG
jgi:lactate racemase